MIILKFDIVRWMMQLKLWWNILRNLLIKLFFSERLDCVSCSLPVLWPCLWLYLWWGGRTTKTKYWYSWCLWRWWCLPELSGENHWMKIVPGCMGACICNIYAHIQFMHIHHVRLAGCTSQSVNALLLQMCFRLMFKCHGWNKYFNHVWILYSEISEKTVMIVLFMISRVRHMYPTLFDDIFSSAQYHRHQLWEMCVWLLPSLWRSPWWYRCMQTWVLYLPLCHCGCFYLSLSFLLLLHGSRCIC